MDSMIVSLGFIRVDLRRVAIYRVRRGHFLMEFLAGGLGGKLQVAVT